MKKVVGVIILGVLAIAGYMLATSLYVPEPGGADVDRTVSQAATPPSLEWLNDVDMAADPMTLRGNNIYKVICQVGHPVLVSRQDLDTAYLVHFKGPFVQTVGDDDKHRFAHLALEDADTGSWTTTIYYDRIEGYLDNAIKGELLQTLRIPMIDSLLPSEGALVDKLGRWDYEHPRSGNKKRVVYAQRVCMQGQLRPGAYFDIVDGRLTRAKAVKDRERLTQVIYDQRTYSEENPIYSIQDDFIAYGEEPVARDGALDVLLEFVVARELGQWDKAYEHLGMERGTDESLRRLSRPTEEGVEMDVASLKYRTVGYQDETLEVLVEYNLMNGTHVQHRYGLRPFNGRWRIDY
ncbi:hypothetical protein [Microbulbifer sp.]|uniref:hypothetical protein n=1 Tax=Microbulbifer sp. TaxID=1908541 RepID=UPI003F40A134